jgi:hypothetical protein
MPVDWAKLQVMIRRLRGDGSPELTVHTIPDHVMTELEVLCSDIGIATPMGDYDHGKVLKGSELQHAVEVSGAYEQVIQIILGLVNEGNTQDEEAYNALSECGFLKRFVNIEPTVCNQTTSKELLECLAMVKRR